MIQTSHETKIGLILLIALVIIILSGQYGPDWVSPIIILLFIPVVVYFRNDLLKSGTQILPIFHKKVIFWSAILALIVISVLKLGMIRLALG